VRQQKGCCESQHHGPFAVPHYSLTLVLIKKKGLFND
jgi:hypothetical protein